MKSQDIQNIQVQCTTVRYKQGNLIFVRSNGSNGIRDLLDFKLTILKNSHDSTPVTSNPVTP